MGAILGTLVGIIVVVWIWLKWQTVRAQRLLNADWAIRTELPIEQIHKLVAQGIKGHNPIASFAQPEPGVYERWLARGLGKRSRNRAMLSVRLLQAEGVQDETVVHCEIPQWEGPAFLGVQSVSAVFACHRRVNAVMRGLQEADPTSALLAHPSRPELMATSDI